MWCLQLVKVINRFIFAVATVDSRNDVFYLDEKGLRVQAAINYFVVIFLTLFRYRIQSVTPEVF